MEIKYNVTGKERKALVTAISEIIGEESKYLGVPSCAYEIDTFTVDKAGTLIFDDMTDSDIVENLLEKLDEQGFTFEPNEIPEDETPAPQEATDRLVIEIKAEDMDDRVVQNLDRIIASKGNLIKKALDADNLEYELTDASIKFPWFTREGNEGEANAYAQLAAALVNMAKESKHITAKPKEVENEKFAFRVFLIRLGFVGDEFKVARKLLLKRLKGNSAFKGGARNVSE